MTLSRVRLSPLQRAAVMRAIARARDDERIKDADALAELLALDDGGAS